MDGQWLMTWVPSDGLPERSNSRRWLCGIGSSVPERRAPLKSAVCSPPGHAVSVQNLGEGILARAGQGTEERQSGLAVVGAALPHCGSASCPFVTGLWIERQPDDVPTIGDIRVGHYQISRPTRVPVAVSACRLVVSMPASRSSRS